MIKPGVNILGIKPEMLLGYYITAAIYQNYGYPAVITSVVDGTHSANSLHYKGLAVDIRTKNVSRDDLFRMVAEIREAISPGGFDVVLESTNKDNEHLHLEFDPKR